MVTICNVLWFLILNKCITGLPFEGALQLKHDMLLDFDKLVLSDFHKIFFKEKNMSCVFLI